MLRAPGQSRFFPISLRAGILSDAGLWLSVARVMRKGITPGRKSVSKSLLKPSVRAVSSSLSSRERWPRNVRRSFVATTPPTTLRPRVVFPLPPVLPRLWVNQAIEWALLHTALKNPSRSMARTLILSIPHLFRMRRNLMEKLFSLAQPMTFP